MVALFGLMLGGVVNALADDLPAGRAPRLPRYPAGGRRPFRAWLGIAAFGLRLRCAPQSAVGTASGDREPQLLSWRHPLAEVATSALMTLTYAIARGRHAMPLGGILIWLGLLALFVLIAVIDIEHMRIAAAPLFACALLALLRAIALPQYPPSFASMLVGAWCACLGFTLIYLGGRLFAKIAARHRHQPVTAFGRGDVYLMTVAGLIVGFPHALAAMVLTILLGGIGAVGYSMAKRASGSYQRFSAIPYAPFILTATYAVMLLGAEVSHLAFGI